MMKNIERVNIDDFFKEKITEFQTEFDEQAWEDLEAQLDKKKRKDRVLAWWWHWEKIAAVLVLGFLGYGGYYFFNTPPKQNKKIELGAKQNTEKPLGIEKRKERIIQESHKSPSVKQRTLVNFSQKTIKSNNTIDTQDGTALAEALNLDRVLEEKKMNTNIALQVSNLSISDSLETITATEENKKSANIPHTVGLAFSPIISPNGLQAGLGYTHEFAITEHTSLVSGLAYTPWAANINPLASNAPNSFAADPVGNVRLQTLEIPLEAKIKLTEHLSVSSGISNTFLLQEKINDVVNNDFEWSISSLNIGLQYDLRIGKNSQLNLQPYYRFPLQSIGSADTQISGFGLRAGYSYGRGKKQHRSTMEN